MKILVVNPNTSTGVTKLIVEEAQRAASPTTEIVAATAAFGVPYIETRGEMAIASYATLMALAQHASGCDGAVIAAFGDPGLGGARELLDIPVVGIAEAAMLTACMLGERFSIISVSLRLIPSLRNTVHQNGLSSRLASIRTLSERFGDIRTVQDEHADALVELCTAAVEQDGADVVILGGGPLAGLGRKVADRLPVPTIDGTTAAIHQIETLVTMASSKATLGSFSRPRAKAAVGLSLELTGLIERVEVR